MTFKPLTFDLAFKEWLAIEGGLTSDAGGTKYGITQETLTEYLDKHNFQRYPISQLVEPVAGDILHENWWMPLNIAQLRPDLGLALFLEVPNLPWRAGEKILQGVMLFAGLYKGSIDGDIGPQTMEATKNMPAGSVINLIYGYVGHYATNASAKMDKGLIKRRLQMVAEAVGRLPIQGE